MTLPHCSSSTFSSPGCSSGYACTSPFHSCHLPETALQSLFVTTLAQRLLIWAEARCWACALEHFGALRVAIGRGADVVDDLGESPRGAIDGVRVGRWEVSWEPVGTGRPAAVCSRDRPDLILLVTIHSGASTFETHCGHGVASIPSILVQRTAWQLRRLHITVIFSLRSHSRIF